MRSTVVKDTVMFSGKGEGSILYSFTGSREIEMKESSVVESGTVTLYFHMGLWQAALHKSLRTSKGCCQIIIEMKCRGNS